MSKSAHDQLSIQHKIIRQPVKLILRKVPIFKIKMGTFLKINVWGERAATVRKARGPVDHGVGDVRARTARARACPRRLD
jgi:hypothetical protein